jgi:hypothetical protein
MSILEDFASGFLQTYKADMDKKAENDAEYKRRKAELNDRLRLANEQAKIERRERAAERRAIKNETPVYEGVEGDARVTRYGDGREERRQMSEGEYNQYLDQQAAAAAEAERKGVIDDLTAEEKRANIAQRQSRADLNRRTDPNREREQSFRLSEEDAALVLGVVPSIDERGRKIYTPDQLAKIRELQGQQVSPATYEEMRRLAQQKRNAMQGAANNALSSNLIR